nr:restriction endonuclease subunit S [Gilliamella sp. Pas-s25]
MRFKKFEGDSHWNIIQLGDISDIIGGGTPSTSVNAFWNGDIDWYSPTEIGEQIYLNNSEKKITQLGLAKSSAKILPIGTILYTSRAGIGNTAILAKEGCTNQGFQSIVPYKNKLDSYFIYSRSNELKKYGQIKGAGSTFTEVSGKQMAQMPITLPKLSEQTKIGNFFKLLDDKIALEQKKLDKLKNIKQAYLNELFV